MHLELNQNPNQILIIEMKTIYISLVLVATICVPSILRGQSFYLSVNYYENSCTKERTNCYGESQLYWSLDSNKAIMYYGTNRSPINRG